MKKLLQGALVLGTIAGASLIGSAPSFATTSCVDGTVKSNIVSVISPDDTVTVTTKNNAPLCKDLILHWDSYTMPDTYDGKAFTAENMSVGPQTKFDGTTITIKAGQNSGKATVKLPQCKNVQTDLYYGPEITTVTSTQHHGVNFINGEINGFASDLNGSRSKDLAACQTPVTPPVTTTPETPKTPTAPTAPTATPIELPSTGSSEIATGIIATALAAGAYAAAYVATKKRAV